MCQLVPRPEQLPLGYCRIAQSQPAGGLLSGPERRPQSRSPQHTRKTMTACPQASRLWLQRVESGGAGKQRRAPRGLQHPRPHTFSALRSCLSQLARTADSPAHSTFGLYAGGCSSLQPQRGKQRNLKGYQGLNYCLLLERSSLWWHQRRVSSSQLPRSW